MKRMVMTMVAMVVMTATMNAKSHESIDPMEDMWKVVNLDNVTATGRKNNTVYANATMLNNENCMVKIDLNDETVYTVAMVATEEINVWNKLVNKYNEVVKQYIKKHGKPYSVATKMSAMASVEGMEMTGLRMGEVIYGTVWDEKDCLISVQIARGARVVIRYDKK